MEKQVEALERLYGSGISFLSSSPDPSFMYTMSFAGFSASGNSNTRSDSHIGLPDAGHLRTTSRAFSIMSLDALYTL